MFGETIGCATDETIGCAADEQVRLLQEQRAMARVSEAWKVSGPSLFTGSAGAGDCP
jgi:hypothetical protein